MADGILTPCNVARSRHWFRQVIAPCNVACGSGIMTVNSPSGSTLQCDKWLWDDMLLNSPKRPHVILYQSAKFYPNRTTFGRKKWREVDFQDGGSQPSWILGIQWWVFEKPNYITSYMSTRHHSSKLLSFPENRVFVGLYFTINMAVTIIKQQP